jgi:hypothetical protein
MRPTETKMERAVVALVPFVNRWHLPLNPEELYEMASAVLEHADGAPLSDEVASEIDQRVNKQLDEYDARIKDQRRYRE